MSRLRYNGLGDPSGSTNPLTFADSTTTAGSWTSAPGFPTITSPDFAVITVEPGTASEEIVYLTAYTAGATSGTFTRAAEVVGSGSTATAYAHSSKPWVHAPTAQDFAGVQWTKLLTSDPMSTLGNWTTRGGTWTAGGTYGVNQTDTAGSDDALECDVDLTLYDCRAIEATLRLTGSGIVGVGMGADGSWTKGYFRIAMDDSNQVISSDLYGTGGSSIPFTVADNVDYTVKMVETSAGTYKFYVNGTLQWTTAASGAVSRGRVFLYCRNAAGWFRNVTVWGGVESIPT